MPTEVSVGLNAQIRHKMGSDFVILSACPTLRCGYTPRQLFSTELFSGWPVTSQTKQSIHNLAGGKLIARPASHHLLISPRMCGSYSSTDPVVSFILFCDWLLLLLHRILMFDIRVEAQNRDLWSMRTPRPVWDQLRFIWVCLLTLRNSQ